MEVIIEAVYESGVLKPK
ncbi:antitoxin AF2212-like protein, partial [Thermococcus sp.]